MADVRTPYKMGLIRMAIIRAMIEGKITYRTAMDLQRMTSNVGLTMAAERLGIRREAQRRANRPPEKGRVSD